jgi:hypothetical protein
MSLYTPGRRSLGTNPRALTGKNKWAVRAWKRKRRQLGITRPEPLMTMAQMKEREPEPAKKLADDAADAARKAKRKRRAQRKRENMKEAQATLERLLLRIGPS